ncbi:unnamed protein product [Lupinus luteus]|uniref:Uncharacterized protein n=1 Tax=Lupinus luteus TaxID=3873 RepID=A0AAV1WQ49_LUPLU
MSHSHPLPSKRQSENLPHDGASAIMPARFRISTPSDVAERKVSITQVDRVRTWSFELRSWGGDKEESYNEIVFPEPSDGFLARVLNHPAVTVPRLPAGLNLPSPVPINNMNDKEGGASSHCYAVKLVKFGGTFASATKSIIFPSQG